MKPFILPPNPVRRFYRGGPGIAALRCEPASATDCPEDWIGATTVVWSGESEGIGRLEDGRTVSELIADDGSAVLGTAHLAEFGNDPALLVKLLDAGERLPVHLHPGRRTAAERWGLRFGKTEAWVILAAPAGSAVWLGFEQDSHPQVVADHVLGNHTHELLTLLRRVPVQPGDALLVPAGTPHAIGPGVLIVELQEPTDLSILLEWNGRVPEAHAHLGLGWEAALTTIDYSAMDDERLNALRGDALRPGRVLPALADPYFRADRVDARPGVRGAPGFAILIGVRGSGEIVTSAGGAVTLGAGTAVLIPCAAGSWRLTGDLVALQCRPPAPDTSPGPW